MSIFEPYYCDLCRKYHQTEAEACDYQRVMTMQGTLRNGAYFKFEVDYRRLEEQLLHFKEAYKIDDDEFQLIFSEAIKSRNKALNNPNLIGGIINND